MNYFSFYKDGRVLYCHIFTAFLFTFSSSFAANSSRYFSCIFQQNQIKGTVTDGYVPLPGVTIGVKGSGNNYAITDYSGQYVINAATKDTLIVSFIGFKTKYVPINGSTKVDIKLEYDTTTLQEVQVNAGYYSVKESERTGSIARITSKDIETQPVTNVLATMQGRMAGVNITQTTGVPGGNFDIKIRGQNSLRPQGNNPLYVIDGVPYSSDPLGHTQISTLFPYATGALNGINPDQIESIEVLKDADATSIYGSRGANGVVLITTKKGRKGKTAFAINASTGTGNVTRFVSMMNTQEYLSMRRKAYANDGITQYPASAYDVNGTWDQDRYTDWQKEIFGGTALFTDLQGTASGGSENTTFLLSGNYHTETTVFPGDFIYKKGGALLNLNHRSDDKKFQIQFSAGYTLQDNNQPSSDLTFNTRSIPPNAPELYSADGSLNWAGNTWQNPLSSLDAVFKSNTNDLNANTLLSYEIVPGLTIKSSLGYNNVLHNETRISPSTIYNPAFNITSAMSGLYSGTTRRSSWIIEPQLNWERKLGDGRIGILAGATYQNQSSSQLVQSGIGYSSNSLIYSMAAAARISVLVDNETLYKYQAFFGRINYNFKERYIINLTARRDGSSRFGPGNQFAVFGAVGAAWLFSKEKFINNSSLLSFGKLRVSYGTTGSDQIGDYQFLDSYTTSGLPYGNITGLQPTRLFNPNYAWEINKKLEAALETGFLADRIFFTSAWYRNRSSNQLVGIPMPGTAGFATLQSNLQAEVENTGWEFTLRTVNFKKRQFQWTTNLNLTLPENKLISYPDLAASPYKETYRLGQPLNIVLLYDFKGVDPQNGLYQFTDVNNDGKISFPQERQTMVDLNPKYFAGLQNQLAYKSWSLDFLFQFVKQKNRSYPLAAAGDMYNQPSYLTSSWQQSGDLAPYQILTAGFNNDALNTGYLYAESTASVEDASFIRLKNISLSYDLPIKNMQCRFMIQGQNILTISPYKGGDPEFTNYGYLPPVRVLTAGIQLTF